MPEGKFDAGQAMTTGRMASLSTEILLSITEHLNNHSDKTNFHLVNKRFSAIGVDALGNSVRQLYVEPTGKSLSTFKLICHIPALVRNVEEVSYRGARLLSSDEAKTIEYRKTMEQCLDMETLQAYLPLLPKLRKVSYIHERPRRKTHLALNLPVWMRELGMTGPLHDRCASIRLLGAAVATLPVAKRAGVEMGIKAHFKTRMSLWNPMRDAIIPDFDRRTFLASARIDLSYFTKIELDWTMDTRCGVGPHKEWVNILQPAPNLKELRITASSTASGASDLVDDVFRTGLWPTLHTMAIRVLGALNSEPDEEEYTWPWYHGINVEFILAFMTRHADSLDDLTLYNVLPALVTGFAEPEVIGELVDRMWANQRRPEKVVLQFEVLVASSASPAINPIVSKINSVAGNFGVYAVKTQYNVCAAKEQASARDHPRLGDDGTTYDYHTWDFGSVIGRQRL